MDQPQEFFFYFRLQQHLLWQCLHFCGTFFSERLCFHFMDASAVFVLMYICNIESVWYKRRSMMFYSGYVVCCYWMQGGKNAENSRRKIFIGGLPANVTDNQLKEYFSKYGHVCSRLCLLSLIFHDFVLKFHIFSIEVQQKLCIEVH